VLAHGHRDLNDEFRRLVAAARPHTAQGREEAGVHAYDAYMNGLLEEVLRYQKATGGSAILTPRNLADGDTARFIERVGVRNSRGDALPRPLDCADRGRARPLTLPATELPEPREVAVELHRLAGALPDESASSRRTGRHRHEPGGRRPAPCTFIAAQVGADPCRSLSRPLSVWDRQVIEHQVLARYGRDADRSTRRILLSTQVIEQSLDLDFDWLLTQLCAIMRFATPSVATPAYPKPANP